MNAGTHTKGPWRADGLCIQSPDGNIGLLNLARPEAESKANAAFIVQCVNSHNALVNRVAELEALTDWKHTDDVSVNRFCVAMINKLAKKRDEGRSGWDDPQECTLGMLAEMLVEHIAKGDPVDIANFCMMVWTRGETDEDHAPAIRAIRAALEHPQSVALSAHNRELVAALLIVRRSNAWSLLNEDAQEQVIEALDRGAP